MEVFLIKAAQLILAFAILVIIHEFGHFLFARIFGIRVEKFYIFFDPWTELFKWKHRKYVGGLGMNRKLADADKSETGKKPGFWSDTEYGIGWLPFGGYCKIAGMIDESMDTEQMNQPAQDWEFRSKPAWQRLLVMIGGVLFNFLLAIIIYAGIVYATGEKYVPMQDAKMGYTFSGEARKIGFHNGDIPMTADGKKLDNPAEGRMAMIQASEVTVLRGNDTVSVSIPKDFMIQMDKEAKSDTASVLFFNYRMPVQILQVMPGGGADKAGLKVGDRIAAVNNTPTESLDEFYPALTGLENKTVNLSVLRQNGVKTDTVSIPVTLSESAKLGVGLEIDPSKFFNTREINYSLLESIPRGIERGTDNLVSYVKSMKMVFTKEGAQSLGGFGTLGSIFPESWNWLAFWNVAAFLSVALAFMNFLPIPALDGGHVLFLLYEVIFRRQPNEKFLERAQIVGMVFLITLLLYANGMDLFRFFFK